MRRVVTLQSSTSVPDGMGGTTETPLAVAEDIAARVEPLEGDEQLRAMATGMVAPHRFTMRYRSDVQVAATLLYAGRTFDIKSVIDPEEKHRELIILADEVE